MSKGAARIAAFQSLRPAQYPWLLRLTIEQARDAQSASSLKLSIELASDTEANNRLVVLFHGVRDLKIDWPQWSVVRLDVIEITDISDRGWEDIRYRVAEGAGMFAFSCRDFNAVVE